MALFYSLESANYATLPVVKQSSAAYGGRIVRFRGTTVFTATAITTADQIIVANIPAGYQFAYGLLSSTVTLATATVAIGTAATPGKYRAAATFTTVTAPVLFGVTSEVAVQTPLPADELVQVTVGVASLPTSGTFTVDLFFSRP